VERNSIRREKGARALARYTGKLDGKWHGRFIELKKIERSAFLSPA
jgi:hypothetical protein